jgi:hypothetical protein
LVFGAELLNIYEFDANRSLDSSRFFDSAQSIPVDLVNKMPHKLKLKEYNFIVKGMTCTSCSGAIEKHFNSLEGIKSISVNLMTNKALVKYDS